MRCSCWCDMYVQSGYLAGANGATTSRRRTSPLSTGYTAQVALQGPATSRAIHLAARPRLRLCCVLCQKGCPPAIDHQPASARGTDCTVPPLIIHTVHIVRIARPQRDVHGSCTHNSGACMTRRTCGHQVPLPWVDPAVPSGLPCRLPLRSNNRHRRGATGTGTGSVRPSSRRSCRLHSPPTRPNPNAPARHCTLVLSACMPHGTKSRERNRRNETSARFHKSWRRRLVPRRTYRQTLFALPIRLHDGV